MNTLTSGRYYIFALQMTYHYHVNPFNTCSGGLRGKITNSPDSKVFHEFASKLLRILLLARETHRLKEIT